MKLDLISPKEAEDLLSNSEVCGVAADSPEMPIGKVLIFSAWVGEDVTQLSIASGLPEPEVTSISAKLHQAGVFGSGDDHAKDYFGDDGGIALAMDIACGMGQIRRGDDSRPGNQTWQMTGTGLDYVESELLPKPEAQTFLDELDASNGKKAGSWRKHFGKRKNKARQGGCA